MHPRCRPLPFRFKIAIVPRRGRSQPQQLNQVFSVSSVYKTYLPKDSYWMKQCGEHVFPSARFLIHIRRLNPACCCRYFACYTTTHRLNAKKKTRPLSKGLIVATNSHSTTLIRAWRFAWTYLPSFSPSKAELQDSKSQRTRDKRTHGSVAKLSPLVCRFFFSSVTQYS